MKSIDDCKSVVVGVTGGSGAIIARRLIGHLLEEGHEVHLCRSRAGRQVIADELRTGAPPAAEGVDALLAGFDCARLREWHERDYNAPCASGTARLDAMVVVPCSMATLGSIANGISDNLIRRAADVMLKEGRPLVLVPRETPLSRIHLRNMLEASNAGARIVPPVLTFYQNPGEQVSAQVDFIVSRILDQLGIENQLFARWGES